MGRWPDHGKTKGGRIRRVSGSAIRGSRVISAEKTFCETAMGRRVCIMGKGSPEKNLAAGEKKKPSERPSRPLPASYPKVLRLRTCKALARKERELGERGKRRASKRKKGKGGLRRRKRFYSPQLSRFQGTEVRVALRSKKVVSE